MCRTVTALLVGLGLLVWICDAQTFGTHIWSTPDNGGPGKSDLSDISRFRTSLLDQSPDVKTSQDNLMAMLGRPSNTEFVNRNTIDDSVPVISMKDATLLPTIPSTASGDILTNQNLRMMDASAMPFVPAASSISGVTDKNTQTIFTKTFPDQNEKMKFGLIGRTIDRNSKSTGRRFGGDDFKTFNTATNFQLTSGGARNLPETAESITFRESSIDTPIAFTESHINTIPQSSITQLGIDSKSTVLNPFKRDDGNSIQTDLFGQIQDLSAQNKQQPSFSVSGKFQDHSKKPTFRVKSQFVDLSPGTLPGMKMIGQFVDTSIETDDGDYTASEKQPNSFVGGIGLPGVLEASPSRSQHSPGLSQNPSKDLMGIGLPGVLEVNVDQTSGNSNQQQNIAKQNTLEKTSFGFSATNDFIEHPNINTDLNINRNTDQNINRNTGQNINRNTGQNINRNTGQNINRNTGQNINRNTGQNINRNTGQNINRNTGQNINRNTDQNINRNTDQNIADSDLRLSDRINTFSAIPDIKSVTVVAGGNDDMTRTVPAGENLIVDNIYPPAPFPANIGSNYEDEINNNVNTDNSAAQSTGIVNTNGVDGVINNINNAGTVSDNIQQIGAQGNGITGQMGTGNIQQFGAQGNGITGQIGTGNRNSGSKQSTETTIKPNTISNVDLNNGRRTVPMVPTGGLQNNGNSQNQNAILRTDPNVQVLNPPNQFINSQNVPTNNPPNQFINSQNVPMNNQINSLVNSRGINTNMVNRNTMNGNPNVLAADRSNMMTPNRNVPSAGASNQFNSMNGIAVNQQAPGNGFRSNIQTSPNRNIDRNVNRMNSNSNQFPNTGRNLNGLPTDTVNSIPNTNPNPNSNVGLNNIPGASVDNRNLQIDPNGRRFAVQGGMVNTGSQNGIPNRAMNGGLNIDTNGNGGRNINGQVPRGFVNSNQAVNPGNRPNSGSDQVTNGIGNSRAIGNGAGFADNSNNNVNNANIPTRIPSNRVNNVVPTTMGGNTQAGFDNTNGKVNLNNDQMIVQNGMVISGSNIGGNRRSNGVGNTLPRQPVNGQDNTVSRQPVNGQGNTVSRQPANGNQFVSNANRITLPTGQTMNGQPTSNQRLNNQMNNVNGKTQSHIIQQQNGLIPNSQGTVMNNQFTGASRFPNAQNIPNVGRNNNIAVRTNSPRTLTGNLVQMKPGTNIQQLQNEQFIRNGQFPINNPIIPNIQTNNRQIIANQRVGTLPTATGNSRGMVPNTGIVQGTVNTFPIGVQTQFGFRGNINANQNFQNNLQNTRIPLSNGGTSFQTGARPFAANAIINSPNGFTQGAVNMNTRMLSGFQDPRMVSGFMPNQRLLQGNQFGSNNLGFPRIPF